MGQCLKQPGSAFEPLAPERYLTFKTPAGIPPQALERRALTGDFLLQLPPRQIRGQPLQPAALMPGVHQERLTETPSGAVEALARGSKQVVGTRQAAPRRANARAAFLDQAPKRPAAAGGKCRQAQRKLAAHRHRAFSGSGRSGGTSIGSVIDEGPIALVADC